MVFVVAEKQKNMVWPARLHARVAMEEDLLSVCELARALVNRGPSMNIATFSTDLQEQCHKSYVAT